jgi:Putative Tad-like Flp pilus-assembly
MTTDSHCKRRRLLRDNRGTTIVLVAITLPVLLGFVGLGVEAGLWWTIFRHNQSAADFAALSGAFELAAGKPYQTDICALAQRDAARNGFTFQSFACPALSRGCTNPASGKMCANNPPVLGPSAGDLKAVEVILAQQQNTFFASLFLPNVTIDARAVAKVQNNGLSCDTALDPTAGKAIQFQGNTTVNLNCSFASNSTSPDSIDISGSTTLNANSLWTVGNWSTNGNPSISLSSGSFTQVAPVTDPYAGKITYTKPTNATCTNWTSLLPTGSGSLSPLAGGQFYCPMTFNSGNNVTLSPGVYLINGETNQNDAFRINTGATVSGTGVTIIATGTNSSKAGAFNIQGGTVTLVAPTTSLTPPGGGTVPSGLLFYQDPSIVDAASVKANSTITANSNDTLTGAIYTPAKNVTFTGNSTSNCTVVIADTMTFIGTSSMTATQSACATAGVSAPTVLTLGLTE